MVMLKMHQHLHYKCDILRSILVCGFGNLM